MHCLTLQTVRRGALGVLDEFPARLPGAVARARRKSKMTPEQRLEIRIELARRMGWTCITGDVGFNPERSDELAYCPDAFKKAICSHMKKPLPAPFTNAADNRALVKLLADADDEIKDKFNTEIEARIASYGGFDALTVLTTSLETVTLAAARALGIPEASE